MFVAKYTTFETYELFWNVTNCTIYKVLEN